MKLLVLGGTVFLGRACVEAALERGHEVTLFNRGQHNADWFPNVENCAGTETANSMRCAGGSGTRSLTPVATSPASSGSPRSCWRRQFRTTRLFPASRSTPISASRWTKTGHWDR